MSLAPISQIQGSAIAVDGDDIDTDRIIPARFLKCVTFNDLIPGLFADDRAFVAKGETHPLDTEQGKQASLLVVGKNFGCGSSREHAPQAILRSGFRAVIGHSFAEIFFGNASGIGLPCVMLQEADLAELKEQLVSQPQLEVEVDLVQLEVRLQGGKVWPCTLKEGPRKAFLEGRWDNIAALLEAEEQITETEIRLGLQPSK